MREFLIRISFIFVVLIFYFIGDFIFTIENGIDFKYILPAFSLVFWDYYFSLFLRSLFFINICTKRLLKTDENPTALTMEIQLLNKSNKNVKFKVNEIYVLAQRVTPSIIYGGKEYYSPNIFECNIDKNSNSDFIFINCIFDKSPIPRKSWFGSQLSKIN